MDRVTTRLALLLRPVGGSPVTTWRRVGLLRAPTMRTVLNPINTDDPESHDIASIDDFVGRRRERWRIGPGGRRFPIVLWLRCVALLHDPLGIQQAALLILQFDQGFVGHQDPRSYSASSWAALQSILLGVVR